MSLWPGFSVANIDAGVLYVLALTGVRRRTASSSPAGPTNSKYAFLGAMRSAAQIVAYEIAMGFALVGVVMASGTLNLGKIVAAQSGGMLSFYWFWLLPLVVVYFISGVAETNRAPFDVAEGESEIVAGFHVEYSGIAFALFFLSEYANMILISALTSTFFFGGWLSPFEGYPYVGAIGWLAAPGLHWFALKIAFFLFCFLWFRATFPRYRYDQIMRLGWKVFIPVTLVWIVRGSRVVVPAHRPVGGGRYAMRNVRQDVLPVGAARGALRSRCGSSSGRRSPSSIPRRRRRSRRASAACTRCAATERPGALHRLQAVRGGLPGARDHDRVRRGRRRHAPHDALRHRSVQVHLLRLLRGGLSRSTRSSRRASTSTTWRIAARTS